MDPRIRQRRVDIRRDQGRRRLRWLLAAAVVVAVVVLGLFLLHTPLFSARVVRVTGAHPHTSTAAIVRASGLESHPPLIDVDSGAVSARVTALPFVARATVTRHWPDGVTVAVVERAPAIQMAGPGTGWSVLDRAGRTLERVGAEVPGLPILAVHAPGPVVPAAVGHRLPTEAAPGVTVAASLPAAFKGQVVGVTQLADGSVTLGLTSHLTVVLGNASDLHQKYVDVAAIIAHADLRGKTTIDVSVPGSPTVS